MDIKNKQVDVAVAGYNVNIYNLNNNISNMNNNMSNLNNPLSPIFNKNISNIANNLLNSNMLSILDSLPIGIIITNIRTCKSNKNINKNAENFEFINKYIKENLKDKHISKRISNSNVNVNSGSFIKKLKEFKFIENANDSGVELGIGFDNLFSYLYSKSVKNLTKYRFKNKENQQISCESNDLDFKFNRSNIKDRDRYRITIVDCSAFNNDSKNQEFTNILKFKEFANQCQIIINEIYNQSNYITNLAYYNSTSNMNINKMTFYEEDKVYETESAKLKRIHFNIKFYTRALMMSSKIFFNSYYNITLYNNTDNMIYLIEDLILKVASKFDQVIQEDKIIKVNKRKVGILSNITVNLNKRAFNIMLENVMYYLYYNILLSNLSMSDQRTIEIIPRQNQIKKTLTLIYLDSKIKKKDTSCDTDQESVKNKLCEIENEHNIITKPDERIARGSVVTIIPNEYRNIMSCKKDSNNKQFLKNQFELMEHCGNLIKYLAGFLNIKVDISNFITKTIILIEIPYVGIEYKDIVIKKIKPIFNKDFFKYPALKVKDDNNLHTKYTNKFNNKFNSQIDNSLDKISEQGEGEKDKSKSKSKSTPSESNFESAAKKSSSRSENQTCTPSKLQLPKCNEEIFDSARTYANYKVPNTINNTPIINTPNNNATPNIINTSIFSKMNRDIRFNKENLINPVNYSNKNLTYNPLSNPINPISNAINAINPINNAINTINPINPLNTRTEKLDNKVPSVVNSPFQGIIYEEDTDEHVSKVHPITIMIKKKHTFKMTDEDDINNLEDNFDNLDSMRKEQIRQKSYKYSVKLEKLLNETKEKDNFLHCFVKDLSGYYQDEDMREDKKQTTNNKISGKYNEFNTDNFDIPVLNEDNNNNNNNFKNNKNTNNIFKRNEQRLNSIEQQKFDELSEGTDRGHIRSISKKSIKIDDVTNAVCNCKDIIIAVKNERELTDTDNLKTNSYKFKVNCDISTDGYDFIQKILDRNSQICKFCNLNSYKLIIIEHNIKYINNENLLKKLIDTLTTLNTKNTNTNPNNTNTIREPKIIIIFDKKDEENLEKIASKSKFIKGKLVKPVNGSDIELLLHKYYI